MKGKLYTLTALATLLGGVGTAAAQDQRGRSVFQPDGTVQVPAFSLPPSSFLSKEALEQQKGRATMAMPDRVSGGIEEQRANMEKYLAPGVATFKQRYPVDIVEQKIAGVSVRVFTPKGTMPDPKRVLINLHGGAFNMCANACAHTESIPIASVGKFKVISVDYRQGPEHLFPAASEDVAAVYRELLKTWRPKQIGIYGCSAGGALAAQAAAWLPAKGLPQVGAIGIFGAGAVRGGRGDSNNLAIVFDGPPQAHHPDRLDKTFVPISRAATPMIHWWLQATILTLSPNFRRRC